MIGELTPGAQLRFVTGYDAIPEFTGTVLAVEPERLLEFTWGADTLRFEIEAAEGATARWAEVHPGYVAAFGPEASTVGPPS